MAAARPAAARQEPSAPAEQRPARPYDNVRVVVCGAFCEQPPLPLMRALEKAGCYVVDDDLWYQSMMRSARDNTQLAEAARQGVAILGPDTQAAARLDNLAATT